MARRVKKIGNELGQALFSDTERLEMWLAANWKKSAVAAVCIALVVAAAFGIVWKRAESARKASHALADAATIAELESALKKSPAAPGAALAKYRLAHMYMNGKDAKKAYAKLVEVGDDASIDPMLRDCALLESGYALELGGDLAGGAARFQTLAFAGENSPAVRGEAGVNAARLLIKLKKLPEAAAVLQKVKSIGVNTPGVSFFVLRANNQLIALENGEFGTWKPVAKVL